MRFSFVQGLKRDKLHTQNTFVHSLGNYYFQILEMAQIFEDFWMLFGKEYFLFTYLTLSIWHWVRNHRHSMSPFLFSTITLIAFYYSTLKLLIFWRFASHFWWEETTLELLFQLNKKWKNFLNFHNFWLCINLCENTLFWTP